MLQFSTKKDEKGENAEILNLKKIANQAVLSQRTLFDDRIKLKKHFKFN